MKSLRHNRYIWQLEQNGGIGTTGLEQVAQEAPPTSMSDLNWNDGFQRLAIIA